ncbi:bucentaur or craniofacial development-domain-containing protein [Flagelloscypha sp. PMI_526]|nr:bucentaur or craniofacial development-domain-containing protein [Flagelloscypha sp. PMI_526]
MFLNQTIDSDSSDDEDYVPPTHDSSSEDERPSKRARTATPEPPPTVQEQEDSKRAQDALYAEFKASAEAMPSTSKAVVKMVQVVKKFRFAGQETTEIVEVPEDSEDAKTWPRHDPSSLTEVPGSMTKPPDVPSISKSRSKPALLAPRKPPPKLAALPAGKAKKLSTLDKSAMDWKAHVSQSGDELKDALSANRRGGGYLEKTDFLHRVDEKRADAFDLARGSKRRRP